MSNLKLISSTRAYSPPNFQFQQTSLTRVCVPGVVLYVNVVLDLVLLYLAL